MVSTNPANIITITASDYGVKSVKISKSSIAEVVRVFTLQLKKGQNSVSIRGLPSVIKSIRPSLPTSDGIRVDDFLFTVNSAASGSAATESVMNTSEIYTPGVHQDLDDPVPSDSSIPESSPFSAPQSLRFLLVREAALNSARQLKQNEAKVLTRYAQSLSPEHLPPAEIAPFLKTYAAEHAKLINEVTEINEELVKLQREITAERARLALKAGETDGRVSVVITTDTDIDTTFKITYIVDSCSWLPVYELHATTDSSGRPSTDISLHYLALVSQSTGEDWKGAELTLSTMASELGPKRMPRWPALKVRPAIKSSNIPSLPMQRPQQLDTAKPLQAVSHGTVQQVQQQQQQFQQQQQQQFQQQQQPSASLFGAPRAFFQSTPFGGTANFGHKGFGSMVQEDEYEHINPNGDPTAADTIQGNDTAVEGKVGSPASVVRETPLSMVFAVAGGASWVPSDGLSHRVSLAILRFASTISYVTSPRDDTSVFLQCDIKNTSDYRLLAGTMSIIVDDSFVSSTVLDSDVNPSEILTCALGPSMHTKVTYTRTTTPLSIPASAFAEVKDAMLHKTTIIVHNAHSFALERLVVKERLPTCDDRSVSIVLHKPDLLAGPIYDASGAAKKEETEEDGGKGKSGQTVRWEPLLSGRGGEKEGRFEWIAGVESGKSVEFRLEYEVRVPRGVAWTF